MIFALSHCLKFNGRAGRVKTWLQAHGHEAYSSYHNVRLPGLYTNEKEKCDLALRHNYDAIREHWKVIQECDAALVLNYTNYDVVNYVGGNSFLEMGFAHILKKPIYLLNPIPEIPHYEPEIRAMRPIILNGDLSRALPRK